jgi:hypothetical protein
MHPRISPRHIKIQRYNNVLCYTSYFQVTKIEATESDIFLGLNFGVTKFIYGILRLSLYLGTKY